MRSSNISTTSEDLIICVSNISGLMGRVKKMDSPNELLLQTAIEQIRTYNYLRESVYLSEEQLRAYDKFVNRVKLFFEYSDKA